MATEYTTSPKVLTPEYDKASDKNVGNFIVYGKAADHKLYYESAYTTQIPESLLQHVFKVGRVIINDAGVLKAVVVVDDEDAKTLEFTGQSGSETMKFTTWSAKADE